MIFKNSNGQMLHTLSGDVNRLEVHSNVDTNFVHFNINGAQASAPICFPLLSLQSKPMLAIIQNNLISLRSTVSHDVDRFERSTHMSKEWNFSFYSLDSVYLFAFKSSILLSNQMHRHTHSLTTIYKLCKMVWTQRTSIFFTTTNHKESKTSKQLRRSPTSTQPAFHNHIIYRRKWKVIAVKKSTATKNASKSTVTTTTIGTYRLATVIVLHLILARTLPPTPSKSPNRTIPAHPRQVRPTHLMKMRCPL